MWQPQNVNYISIKGLDIEIRSQINEFMDIYVEGTYLNSIQRNSEVVYDFYDGMADTGLTIIEEVERDAVFTPKYIASTKINFNLPYEFAINFYGSLVTERFNYYSNYDDYPNVTMDVKTLDSYFIFNANVSKKMFRYLTLSVGAKNILDVEYATQFGYTVSDLNYPMPGRTLFVQLIWQQK